jgi:hypothetical protein
MTGPGHPRDASGIGAWLARADVMLASEPTEDDVDTLLQDGLAIDVPSGGAADGGGTSDVDQVTLARVIAAITARRAATAVELNDLARRRRELERAASAAAAYARGGLGDP